jgi:hypothetical protein
MALVLALNTSACGRIAFDAIHRGDGAIADATVDAPPDPSLVAWYTCDDDLADGNEKDETGHGHDAICTPGVSCPTLGPGVIGMACIFDGTSQYLQVAGDPAFTTGMFTIALRAKKPSLQGQALIEKPVGNQFGDSWGILCDTSVCASTDLRYDGGAMTACIPAADVMPGDWVHVAITYDGATKLGYVNGQQRLSLADTTVSFDNSPLFIAADRNQGIVVGFYPGALDDIRIYDRPLEATEIAALAAPP